MHQTQPKIADIPTKPNLRRCVLICTSPKSGSGAGRDQVPLLEQLLDQLGIDCLVTTSIQTLRKELAKQQDLLVREDLQAESEPPTETIVVAAGGDGTVALVADNTPPEFPIVPLPLGTENLLARHYGFKTNAHQTVDTIVRGRDCKIDAGRANGKLFLVMVTAGYDAEVVRSLHLRRKGHISKWSYAKPIWRAARKYRFPEITLHSTDGSNDNNKTATSSGSAKRKVGRWAMIFNLPMYGGGLSIEPNALGDDGKFDVISLGRGGLLSGLGYLASIWTGKLRRRSDAEHFQSTTIRLESEQRVPYQIDGDYAGRLPVEIEMLPASLKLRMPADRAAEKTDD